MIAALAARGGWLSRRDFIEWHGFSRDGRECRAGRAASHGRILHGQNGFALTRDASESDIMAAIDKEVKEQFFDFTDNPFMERLCGIVKKSKIKCASEANLGNSDEAESN